MHTSILYKQAMIFGLFIEQFLLFGSTSTFI